jgi:hypothetical protein
MHVSIKNVFILCGAGLLVVVLTLIISFSHMSSKKVLDEHVRALMAEKANRIIEATNRKLRRARFVAELEAERLLTGDLAQASMDDIERDLLRQVASFPDFTGIYIGWADGRFLYVKRAEGPDNARYRTLEIERADGNRRSLRTWRDENFDLVTRDSGIDLDYDPRERPWYQNAASAGEPRWTAPYLYNTSRTPGITIAAPAHVPGDGVSLVVGIDLNIHDVSTGLVNLDLVDGSLGFIATPQGKLIASSRDETGLTEDGLPTVQNARLPLLENALATVEQPLTEVERHPALFHAFQFEGRDHHLFLTQFSNETRPWIIGLIIPDAPFLAPLDQSRRLYLAIALVITLGLGIAAH